MARQIGPHELLKTILTGTVPPRPLFLPTVFSHAARIENLPLRTFLSNPTKITQALRQLRGHLRSDGLTCYFDPYLEVEALGTDLDWGAGNTPIARWASSPVAGDLHTGFGVFDQIATKGRLPVAVEVIRRMKSMFREEVLLTVGISGPFRLATQLMPADPGAPGPEEISAGALELATEITAAVAKALVEAGANVVIISEELAFAAPDCPDLTSLLATTINIVRFYQALPVLLLKGATRHQNLTPGQIPDCMVCPTLSETAPRVPQQFVNAPPTSRGASIPVSVISAGQPGIEEFSEEFHRLNPGFQPVMITTADDIPETADLKNWNKLCDLLTA